MKRVIKVLIIVIIGLITLPVKAENYKLKDLIPLNTKTTIHTDSFNYIELYSDGENVYFNGVLNLTEEERYISVSIGLFDKKGINIGTINDCNKSLLKVRPKDQLSHKVEINESFIAKGKNRKDIRYIAILGDNLSCRTTGSNEFVGKHISEIGKIKKGKLTEDVILTIKILVGVGLVILLAFLYKLFFTKQYVNINGETIRKEYNNKEKDKEKKEKFVFVDKPIEKNNKKEKFVIEDKKEEETDLSKLYK